MRRALTRVALPALGLSACLGTPMDEPAVLEPDWVPTARAALATALGRGTVELGEPDPTRAPVLIVLPPPPGPYETNSPALPLRYDLRLVDTGCAMVPHDGEGNVLVLSAAACRPFVFLGGD